MNLVDRLRTVQLARSIREKLNSAQSLNFSPHAALVREINLLGIESVLDGGANVGQFGLDLYRHGFTGSIYSFEPVLTIFDDLRKTANRYTKWQTFNLGLGQENSSETINISGNAGLSSSILDMKESHLANFPDSLTVAKEKIRLTRISDEIERLNLLPDKLAIKLDVQGFEYQALLGAGEYLSVIPVCFLELSLDTLYSGEHDYLRILNFLFETGHEVVDLFRGITAKNGRLLQIDVITKQKKFR